MTALDLMIYLQNLSDRVDLSKIPVMFLENFVATQAQRQHVQIVDTHKSDTIEFITQFPQALVIGSIPEVD